MGKIYCTECGAELNESVKFCSSCGTPVNDTDITPNSDETKENKDNSNNAINIKEISEKSNNNKYSNTTKIFLGIAGICVIIFIIGIVMIGLSISNTSNDVNINEDNSEEPFIETIYGIDFSIPGYFKEVKSTDYEDDGNGGLSCTRTYERPDGTGIAIVVSTNPDGWNLNNGDGVFTTINGHYGKLSSTRDVFGYQTGDKLVVISGTSQEEVEEIIIE